MDARRERQRWRVRAWRFITAVGYPLFLAGMCTRDVDVNAFARRLRHWAKCPEGR